MQANLAFVFIAADPKGDVPGRLGNRILRATKKNRALKTSILAQAQDEMFFLQDLGSYSRLHLARENKRLGVALDKGLEELVPAQQIPIHLAQFQFGIEPQHRLKLIGR